MEISIDHYRVLNLPSDENSPNLTEEDISRAYKKMALKLHPDKNPEDPNAHIHFQKLLSSYQFLKNPQSRKGFDRLLQINRRRKKMDFDFQQQRKKYEERQQAKNPKADFNFQQQSKKQEQKQKQETAAKATQPDVSDILKELKRYIKMIDLIKEIKSLRKETKKSELRSKIQLLISLMEEIRSLIKETKESECISILVLKFLTEEMKSFNSFF